MSRLYVFGGGGEKSIEWAPILDDGQLEAFQAAERVEFVRARTAHTTEVVGDFVYALGGATEAASSSASVERALIGPNGTLGQFVEVPDLTLTVPRVAHISTVIGDYVYVIGGARTPMDTLDTVERAHINPDGSLAAFSTVNATLRNARRNFSGLVVGTFFYVFGGLGVSGELDVIERAPIGTDGSLGEFEAVSASLSSPGFGQAIFSIGNAIIATGGLEGALIPSDGVTRAVVDAVDDISAFSQSGEDRLAIARGSHSAVRLGDFVYLTGGSSVAGVMRGVERGRVTDDDRVEDFENLCE